MKLTPKKFIASVVALSFLTLTGCSSTKVDTSATAEGGDSTKPVEIRFAWWGDTKRNELYNAICDNFQKDNSNIKIVREVSSWNDYFDKLATQTAGGNAPEVFGIHPNFVSDYARRGAMQSIEEYVKSGTIDLSNFSQSVVDGGKVNGVNYMVSQGITFSNQMINLTLFDKLKVEKPSSNWTWEEFASKAKEIKAAAKKAGMNDVYGTHDNSNMLQYFRYMVRQEGRDLYDKDGNITFTEADAEKWFEFWKDLRDSGAMPSAATANEHAKDTLEQNLFTNSKIGVALFAVNQIALYQEQMGDTNLGLMRNPTSANGKNGEYIEGAFLAISSKSDKSKQDAAAKFINYFVNSEDSLKLFKLEQGVPGNTKMAEYIKPLLSEPQQKALVFVNDTVKYAEVAVYPPKGATPLDAAFRDAAANVAYGDQSPAQAAKSLVEQCRQIIQSNK